MRKLAPVLTFVLLWTVWYFCYPYFLIWLEGFSFFSTLPDFTEIHFKLPQETLRYIGAFLLQFYSSPLAGAFVQALMPTLFLLCTLVVVRRLFCENEGLEWLAYLPLPLFVYFQMSDMTLTRTLTMLSAAAAVALTVFIATLWRKPFRHLPKFLHNRYLDVVLMLCMTALSAGVLMKDGSLSSHHEDIAYLEYLGEHKQWDEILETVSVQESLENEYKRKYVLLALSETGRLTEHAFRYGLSSSEDFLFYNLQEPLCLGFNVLFYRALGMNNPAIYHSYQQSVQSLPGLSFDVMRNLTDIYLEQKDYVMAKKYMYILAHSTCHRRWVRERLPQLESIRGLEPEIRYAGEKFLMESFLPDMSAMVDLYPHEKKYADYLLCGILAEKDGNTFLKVLNVIASTLYPDGRNLPALYQEALLLNASQDASILQKYHIDESVWKRFADFTDLMRQGKATQAKRKYAGTYWAYVY